MSKKPLYHLHEHVDPMYSDGRKFSIGSHVDTDTAFIAFDDGAGSQTAYIARKDVPSAIVALIANTGFMQATDADATAQKLQEIAKEFVSVFREAMVPNFREEFTKAIEGAADDWDAKCRVSDIISRYESLR